jgi:hypothetical protein
MGVSSFPYLLNGVPAAIHEPLGFYLTMVMYTFMRVKAPACPHPKCRTLMTRVYIREAPPRGDNQFRGVGWLCRECGIFIKDP